LLEIQGYILAVSDAGWMHMWNLKEIKKVQGVYVFKNNISLVPSKGQIKIDGNSLTGLQYHNNTIIAYAICYTDITRRSYTSAASPTS